MGRQGFYNSKRNKEGSVGYEKNRGDEGVLGNDKG